MNICLNVIALHNQTVFLFFAMVLTNTAGVNGYIDISIAFYPKPISRDFYLRVCLINSVCYC